jgi:hypothetical protein
LLHAFQHLGSGLNNMVGEILHKDALVGRLLQLEPGFGILAEQIMDLLIVDFEKTALQEVLLIALNPSGACHDLPECSGNYPLCTLCLV